MANEVLHIKDSYYFEVPKLLYPYNYTSRTQFPDVWISLDPEFENWEAERLLKMLRPIHADLPADEKVLHDWQHWSHADHANFAKPLKRFLNEKYESYVAKFNAETKKRSAVAQQNKEAAPNLTFEQYLTDPEPTAADKDYLPFLRWRHTHAAEFQEVAREAHDIREWKADKSVAEWSKDKIASY